MYAGNKFTPHVSLERKLNGTAIFSIANFKSKVDNVTLKERYQHDSCDWMDSCPQAIFTDRRCDKSWTF